MAVFTGRRIRDNNVQGTTTNNPLTAGGTTLNSAGLANLSAVSSNHAVIVLDPLRAAGAPEIVIVTAHTGAATSATITRGAYGTSARQHAAGTLWVHAAVDQDYIDILTASTRPSDQYEGQLIYETDTDRFVMHNGTTWIPTSNFPRAAARRTSTQSITNGAWNLVTFNAEDVDTDTMFTTGTGDRFTCVTPGRYVIHFTGQFVANATGIRGWAIAKGVVAATNLEWVDLRASFASIGCQGNVSGEVVLAAAETVSCQVFQNSGGALNLDADGSSVPCAATIRWVGPT